MDAPREVAKAVADVDARLDREIAYWDARYWPPESAPYTVTAETFASAITPAYEHGGSNTGLTQRRAYELVLAEGVEDREVLDYACGQGGWALRLAQFGARASGFDISPVGISNARVMAEHNALDVRFDVADARRLPYADDSFDICIGIGALHHVIKYEGAASELARVMRPGGLAVFTEVLGHNPFIELARRVTMRGEEDAGDVILTEAMLAEWARPFASFTVEPYSLLFMLKRILRRRYRSLRLLYQTDRVLLRAFPGLRRYCGECVIVARA